MWHGDMKWANAVGKMMPKDLLDTELHKPSISENAVSAKCNKTKYACMNTYSSIIHNSPKMEKTKVSINKRCMKKNVAYPCKGILLSNKKKLNINA